MEKHGPVFQASSARCLPKLHLHASACKCVVSLVMCLNCIHIFLKCLLERDRTRTSNLPNPSETRAWACWWNRGNTCIPPQHKCSQNNDESEKSLTEGKGQVAGTLWSRGISAWCLAAYSLIPCAFKCIFLQEIGKKAK